MFIIKEDSYICPYCGCVFEREELEDPPSFNEAIIRRHDIECPKCDNYGMIYITKGDIGYVMIGDTIAAMNINRD